MHLQIKIADVHVCGSKALGLLEVFSFTPTPSPGVCQKTTYISSGIPIHFLALGRNVFCVQSFSDFWFRRDHSIKFPHCPSQPFFASLYTFFGLLVSYVLRREEEKTGILKHP